MLTVSHFIFASTGRIALPVPCAPARIQIRTHGCQMNVHDSERLAGLLEKAG